MPAGTLSPALRQLEPLAEARGEAGPGSVPSVGATEIPLSASDLSLPCNDGTGGRPSVPPWHLVKAGKLPPGTDVASFVTWLGRCSPGEWQQSDLFMLYLEACELIQGPPLPAVALSAGLAQLGIKRFKLDLRRGGKRFRPTAYVIPRVE